MRFGRLQVLNLLGCQRKGRQAKSFWAVKCDCGTIKKIAGQNLTSGKRTKSCGCLRLERAAIASTSHGMRKSPLYHIWVGMIGRCYNPESPRYKDYGGRGIGLSEEWRHDFRQFVNDMGPRPHGFTVERVDNEKGYSKENCVWASRGAQATNKRNNRILEIDGKRLCCAEWARISGLNPSTLNLRLKRGISPKEAVFGS